MTIVFVPKDRMTEYQEKHPHIYAVPHATIDRNTKWIVPRDGVPRFVDFDAESEHI